MTDRVQLPRLMLAWLTPGTFRPGDAELDVVGALLSSGKNSRLYRRLVYEMQVAQDVSATQYSSKEGSIFLIDVVARPSDLGPDESIARLRAIVDEELDRLRHEPPTEAEMTRVRNGIRASFYDAMETIAGKADQLNAYYMLTGNPDYFAEDLGRYETLAPDDIRAAVRRWLPADRRVELVVVPEEQ